MLLDITRQTLLPQTSSETKRNNLIDASDSARTGHAEPGCRVRVDGLAIKAATAVAAKHSKLKFGGYKSFGRFAGTAPTPQREWQ
jgi:hypothetical protein